MFPNQLLSALIRGDRLFVPNIGAQPEPPEQATVNVQALVNVVDTQALVEVGAGLTNRNLNKQINVETAAPPPSLDKTFGNDIVHGFIPCGKWRTEPSFATTLPELYATMCSNR